MSLAALTFSQEIQKTLVQALATAVSVTVLGGLVATRVSQRWELRREDFELRAGLLDRATRCAQTMFVTCQHVRRVNSDNPGSSGEPARREARTLLDTTYRAFSSEARCCRNRAATAPRDCHRTAGEWPIRCRGPREVTCGCTTCGATPPHN
jgi:hypothetical protein